MMAMTGAGSADECTGLDEYMSCVLDTCGLQDCFDNECADLLSCYQDADDPCQATCTPSTECTDCQMAQSQCILNSCFDLIMCGTLEEGGACDQLTECCAEFADDDPMKFACDAAAMLAPSGGDQACMSALEGLCP
jgi:hypothetical protein